MPREQFYLIGDRIRNPHLSFVRRMAVWNSDTYFSTWLGIEYSWDRVNHDVM